MQQNLVGFPNEYVFTTHSWSTSQHVRLPICIWVDINAALHGTPAIETLYRHKEVIRISPCYSQYSISTILYTNLIILRAAYAIRLQTSESLPTIANHMFWAMLRQLIAPSSKYSRLA
jgi:hypothetical protein